MKTKLALLLIAPALLFTACNKEQEEEQPKEITSSEAMDFIKENYNIHTDDQDNCLVAKEISATWDFKFTGFEAEPLEKLPIGIVQRFFMKLTGFPLEGEEEKCFATKYITRISSNDPSQNPVEKKQGKSHVLDSTDPEAMDFVTGLYSDFNNAKFSLLGKELTISGPAIVSSKIENALSLKVEVEDMKIVFDENGIVKEAYALAKEQNIIDGLPTAKMEGKIDITFTGFVLPNFN
ncbi:MAG: hypothetical protein MJ208_01860 [Bacilli bacterium]|nr:hypothetical protein [Bacilli bacterium]